MAELRFILFIAGLVFLVALAAWELRRPRQAAANDPVLRRTPRSEPEFGSFGEHGAEVPGASQRVRMALTPPRLSVAEFEAKPLVRTEEHPAASQSPSGDSGEDIIEGLTAAPAQLDEASGLAAAAAASEIVVPPPTGLTRSIFIDWPPEDQRHIVSVRVVAGPQDRLSGRAVRLAMTACGFVHGPFGIYHQPDDNGRAIISAASLSKPGVLDPVTMDFQRLAGINLFTVLPGALAPAAALDHLIETARELSQRLAARLQDDQGRPLDADRLEDLRDRMQSLSSSGFHAEPAA
jgi:FtsZ-interacting cell division protein ZipA